MCSLDLPQLAKLDEELRIRLVTAAGMLSRPDRYRRKALGKALDKAQICPSLNRLPARL